MVKGIGWRVLGIKATIYLQHRLRLVSNNEDWERVNLCNTGIRFLPGANQQQPGLIQWAVALNRTGCSLFQSISQRNCCSSQLNGKIPIDFLGTGILTLFLLFVTVKSPWKTLQIERKIFHVLHSSHFPYLFPSFEVAHKGKSSTDWANWETHVAARN